MNLLNIFGIFRLVFIDYVDVTVLYVTICYMSSNWLILNLNSQCGVSQNYVLFSIDIL